MLTEIRDRSSGAFAWVIAALIIIPMAFWGVQEYATTEGNPSLVEIGDQTITQAQFQESLQNEQQRMRARMGDNPNDAFLTSDSFKQSVLDRMVNRALLQQVASDENYRVSNEQLAQEIKQSELFQLDGEFNQEAYERFLIGSQYSKRRYEDSLREDLVVQQVTEGYAESAIVLPDEVRSLLEAQAERRSFDVATLRKQAFIDDVTVSEAEIADYYSENQARFMEPEKVSIEYIELNPDALSEDIDVAEEDLRGIYEQNSAAYMSTARRDTRHILLSTGGDEDDAAQLARAQELVAELRAGADFAELAKANSQDPGSAPNGGSLGLVEPGQMVAEFEEATFALDKDAISDPVKTQFGYHIIQVLEVQASEQQSFEDVRFELLQAERQQRAEEKLLDLTEQLRDLVFEQPGSLDAAAEELGLALLESELFSQAQGSGVAALPAVRNVAFSEEILVDEVNSEPLELADGRTIVLRKLQQKAAAPKTLEEVSVEITNLIKNDKAAAAAQARGEVLLTTASADWDQVASDETLEQASHTVSLIEPNRAVPPQVLQEVSRMQLHNGSAAVALVTDRNNDVHIVRLREVVAGDINNVSEQVKEATRRVIAERNGGSLLSTYIEELKQSKAPSFDASLL